MTVDELPAALPPDVEPLRARIRAMAPAAQTDCLNAWGRLPHLANEDGTTAVLDRDTYRLAEAHIAQFETWADEAHHADLIARIDAMSPGPRLALNGRLATLMLDGPATGDDDRNPQGVANYRNRLHFTVGRAATVEQVLARVLDEADEVVARELGPLPEEAGVIVAQPVADADELGDVIDWGALRTIDEILATVGVSASRARAAYDAEMRRAKPRKGVVSKLAPLVGGQAFGGVESTVDGEAVATAAVDAAPPMLAEGVELPVTHGSAPSGGDRLTDLATTPDADLTPDDAVELVALLEATAPTLNLGKFAAILGRLHAELGAVVKMLDGELHRVDL